jgi:hypothetical protein
MGQKLSEHVINMALSPRRYSKAIAVLNGRVFLRGLPDWSAVTEGGAS